MYQWVTVDHRTHTQTWQKYNHHLFKCRYKVPQNEEAYVSSSMMSMFLQDCGHLLCVISIFVPSHPQQSKMGQIFSEWSWKRSSGWRSGINWPAATLTFKKLLNRKSGWIPLCGPTITHSLLRMDGWILWWHWWGKLQNFSNNIKCCFKEPAAKSVWPFFCDCSSVQKKQVRTWKQWNLFLVVCL